MLGLLALVAASIFFGAPVYINIAEHPARLGLPDGAALAEWGPAYRRGFAMQAPIAVVSALVGAAAWWKTGDPLWALGGVIMIANWPYTLLAIMPTNRRLEATPPGSDANTRDRLVRWGQLHAVRSSLGAAATVVYLIAAEGGGPDHAPILSRTRARTLLSRHLAVLKVCLRSSAAR